MKKIYFMAGLPRSGSTVLSAILNQNKKIKSIWSKHPHFLEIPASQDFLKKIRISSWIVESIVKGSSFTQIKNYFDRFLEKS